MKKLFTFVCFLVMAASLSSESRTVVRDRVSLIFHSAFAPVTVNPFQPLLIDTPRISVSPDTFTVNISACRDSQLKTLSIRNPGTGWLFYNIYGKNFSVPVRLLALTYGVDYNLEYRQTLNALSSYFTNYHLDEINTISPAILDSALKGKDVLLIARQKRATPSVFSAFSGVLKNFVARGGTVIFCGTSTTQFGCIVNSGLFRGTLTSNYSAWNIKKNMIQHPVTRGIDTSFTAMPNTWGMRITNPDAVRLVNFGGTDDIVTIRDTGNGHCIYIAFDYTLYDSNEAKIIAQAVEYSTFYHLPGWLTVSRKNDSIPSGDSNLISVRFNSTGFASKKYDGLICIANNDPSSLTKEIPVHFSIHGNPSFSISDNSFYFDTLSQNYTAKDSLLLYNTGCDTLLITGISSTSSNYYWSLPGMKIPPFDSMKMVITCKPRVTGLLTDTIRIATNDKTAGIILKVFSQTAPQAIFSPDTIRQTLMCNDSLVVPLKIRNGGKSRLTYEILSGSYSPPVEVLGLTYGVAYAGQYSNTLKAIRSRYTNFHLEETNTIVPSVLDSMLKGKDVLLVATEVSGNPVVFSGYAAALQNFVYRGGIVIFCGSDMYNMDCMFNTGLFNGFYMGTINNSASAFTVINPGSPLMLNVPPVISSSNAVHYAFLTDPDKEKILDYNNAFDVVSMRKSGSGRVIFIGYDYSTYDSNASRIVANAVRSASRTALPAWISLSGYGNTLSYQDSNIISLKLSSAGMESGNYRANIVILTNDTLHIRDTIPVFVHINCKPRADFSSGEIVINAGDSVAFTDQSGNFPNSRKWYFPGSSKPFSTQKDPVVSYPKNGFYDVILVVENAYGKDSLARKKYIQVTPNIFMCRSAKTDKPSGILFDPGGPLRNYPDNTTCSLLIAPPCASSVTLTFDSFNLENTFDYLYVFDGSGSSGKPLLIATGNSLPPTVTANSGKMYIVFESDQLLDFQGFRARWTSLQPPGTPPVSSFLVSDTLVPLLSGVQLTDATTNGPYSWQWKFGDGDTTSLRSPLHIYRKPGYYTVTLVTGNCYGTDTFSQVIHVDGYPAVKYTPSGFKTNQPCSEIMTDTLRIISNGKALLSWEIDTGYSGREIRILVLKYGTDYTHSYKTTLQAITKNLPACRISEIYTTDPAVLSSYLSKQDVFLVPEQVSGLPFFFSGFAPVLRDFVNRGGCVIFCGSYDNYSGTMFSTGLFSGSYFDYVYQNTDTLDVNNHHPLTSHLQDTLGAVVVTYLYDITDKDAVRLITYKGHDVVTYRKPGKGTAIFLGFNYYEYNDKTSKILSKAVSWGSSNPLPPWITISKSKGVTRDTEIVVIHYDRKKADTGMLNFNISLYTNDTGHFKQYIPVNITFHKYFSPVVLGNDTMLCPGDSLTLDARSGFSSYIWNDSVTAGRYLKAGKAGRYRVRVIDINNCISADSMNLGYYTAPVLDLAGNKTDFCINDPAEILHADPPGGIFFGKGVDSSEYNPQLAGTGSHMITYRYRDTNNCYSRLDTTFIVHPLPLLNLGRDTTIFKNDSFLLDAGLHVSYNWNNGWYDRQKLLLQGKYMAAGKNLFFVKVADSTGCTNTDSITVTVRDSTSSIAGNKNELLIRIYPNPAHGYFYIEPDHPGEYEIEMKLADAAGKIVLTVKYKPSQRPERIDIRNLPPGPYTIRIKTRDHMITRKLIIY